MIPHYPHNIRIRLAQLKFLSVASWLLMLLSLCPVGCLSFEKLNRKSQQGRDLTTSGVNKRNSIGPIIFLYHEESLVSPNLNSKKQLRFHSVRLNFDTFQTNQCAVLCTWHSKLHTSLLYHYLGSSHVNQTIHNGDISFLKSHSYFSFNFSFTIQDLIRLYSKYWDHAWTYPQPNYGNTVFGNVYLSVGQH